MTGQHEPLRKPAKYTICYKKAHVAGKVTDVGNKNIKVQKSNY